MYIYIKENFKYLQIHNPTDPFYTTMFNTTCIYEEVQLCNMFEKKKYTPSFKKKLEKRQTQRYVYMYIAKIQVFTNTQPNGSTLYKNVLYNMPIQRSLIIQYVSKGKVHIKL